jgi:branched-subunit amino acid aminotransferase/4-amino-4-deoxychorismate lyase
MEADINREELERIEGAFLTSTLMEIRAVSCLDDRVLPTAELPIFKTLVAAFRRTSHQ